MYLSIFHAEFTSPFTNPFTDQQISYRAT